MCLPCSLKKRYCPNDKQFKAMAKKLFFTPQELTAYFTGQDKSVLKDDAVAFAKSLRVHADGTFPKDLIETARPHESEAVKEYRQKIWKSKTKPVLNKVFNSLSKIRRSRDWSIQYPQTNTPRIPEDETLYAYCEEQYPYFTSITNWAFQVLLREYLIDPNAVLLVLPIEIPSDETQIIRPYGMVMNSEWVIDYRHDDYVVIENPLGCTFVENGQTKTGRSFYCATTLDFYIYNQVSSMPKFKKVFEFNHQMNTLPAYKLGAVLIRVAENDFLYESRIASMLPELDEAAREYSDLQAAKVMNIYPERWEITNKDCPDCNGTGKIRLTATALPVPCSTCGGSGDKANSPFSKLVVRHTALDAAAGGSLPIPPAGYVEKDVDVVKVQDDGIKAHLYDALAAVNMEFLASVPLSTSGISKEVDRDETNNFVNSIAEDIVRILDWLYYITAKYRYSVQYPNDEDIIAMCPQIQVPEHFDIFSTKFIEEEIKSAKENKMNPVLINSMEISYASKRFSTEDDIKNVLMLILQLDPLANVSEDDKNSRLQNNGITQEDYIISCNIKKFVLRALAEDAKFAEKPLADQQETMLKYAQEIKDANSSAADILEPEGDEQQLAGQ